MQTLHLRFQALRAISLRRGLSRWRTPSDARRAGMGDAFALPNPPEPTSAVGSQSSTECAGPKDVPRLSYSLRPSCALGWRPASRPPDVIQCPVSGAGVPGVSRLRAARKDSRLPVLPCRVCRWQTAIELSPYPAPHEAGDLGTDHWQARALIALGAASDGPSFPLRPQRCGARSYGEKTADRTANVGPLAGVSTGAHQQRLRPCSVVR